MSNIIPLFQLTKHASVNGYPWKNQWYAYDIELNLLYQYIMKDDYVDAQITFYDLSSCLERYPAYKLYTNNTYLVSILDSFKYPLTEYIDVISPTYETPFRKALYCVNKYKRMIARQDKIKKILEK